MSSLMDYKRLNIPTPDPADVGGHAISKNFKALADRFAYLATSNPTAIDDSSAGFAVGSRWFNTNTSTEWICLDDALDNAVWQTSGAGNLATVKGFWLDGRGNIISTGYAGGVRIPFNATIASWTILSSSSGSVAFDVQVTTFATYPTGTSIVASSPPTMSSSTRARSSTLTGWTTSVNADDYLTFTVTSVASITRCRIELLLIAR